ncbi:MAG: DUF4258 domain-containing protein [Taibaiella sp.]|nr:DUF4258 domain-containing protein [Taibaiella sp.]
MITRFIRSSEVEEVLIHGERIKDYPADKPYPSCLLLKFVNGRPLHVVVSQNADTGECIVITCYEPDPNVWRNLILKKKYYIYDVCNL